MALHDPHPSAAPALPARRRLLAGAAGFALGIGGAELLSGCASSPAELPANPAPWEHRLSGSAVVLLGERHDNPHHHRLRLASLERAVAGGWRPALLMEQFDTDRQADIDRARADRPGDVAHLVAQGGRDRPGWDWAYYTPVVALALRHKLPVVAANLARPQAQQVSRRGFVEALGAERARALGLDAPIAPQLQAAQEREIDIGHCRSLPAAALPGMARSQFARDAVMAELVARHADDGVVLLAGNGHVRRDLGVPRWLRADLLQRTWVVGYLEPREDGGTKLYDAEVITPAPPRTDPCAPLRARGNAPA
jgi:uncharacterized iron-regulated protein